MVCFRELPTKTEIKTHFLWRFHNSVVVAQYLGLNVDDGSIDATGMSHFVSIITAFPCSIMK